MTWRRFLYRTYVLPLLALTLLVAACGTRLPQEEIIALNAADNVTVETGATSGGTSGGTTASESSADGAADVPTNTGATDAPEASPVTTADAGSTGAAAEGGTTAEQAAPASATGGEPSGPATGSTIVVGNIGTYSGIVGAIVGSGQEAIQVWASWANENGGLGGHRVELLTADDAGDPARAQNLAQDYIQNQGAIALVGNLTPFTTGVIRGVAEANETPIVGGDLITLDYFESHFIFPQGADFRTNVLGTAKLGIDKGNTRIGLLLCVEVDVVCSLANDILQEGVGDLGGEIVYSARASLAQPDFTSECIAARDAGVDNLIVYFDGNSLRRLMDSCANQGFTPFTATNPIAFTDATLQSPNTNGIQSAGQVFPFGATDTPGSAKFRQAYLDFAGKPPSAGAQALAWTSGRLLQRATWGLPADNPTAADVVAGLRSIAGDDLEGLTVSLDFSQGLPRAERCYFLTAINDGSFQAPQGSQKSCL